MTVATVESPRSISIRPLAVPNEHGGWSFLLEPIVLALVVAPSLAVLAAARGLPSTMFVRSLRRRQGAAWTIVAHIVALQCAAALWRLEIAPITAVVAMTLLLLRATVGLRRESPRAMTIGLQEVGWGVAVVALIAGGYILR